MNPFRSKAELALYDTDRNGIVSEHEFMLLMMFRLELVSRSEIAQIQSKFREIDKDKDGCICMDDITGALTQSYGDDCDE